MDTNANLCFDKKKKRAAPWGIPVMAPHLYGKGGLVPGKGGPVPAPMALPGKGAPAPIPGKGGLPSPIPVLPGKGAPVGKGGVSVAPQLGRGPPPMAAKRPAGPAGAEAPSAKKAKVADEVAVVDPDRCDNCASKEHKWEHCPEVWKCRICGGKHHTSLFCHKSEAATLVLENLPAVSVLEVVELFKIAAKGTGLRIKGTTVPPNMLTAGSPAFVSYSEPRFARDALKTLENVVLKDKTIKIELAKELSKQRKEEIKQLAVILGRKDGQALADAEEFEEPAFTHPVENGRPADKASVEVDDDEPN